jgi:hypothetical protein
MLANIGYYLRAKTEENHLLAVSPEYRAYFQAMRGKRWGAVFKK